MKVEPSEVEFGLDHTRDSIARAAETWVQAEKSQNWNFVYFTRHRSEHHKEYVKTFNSSKE